LFFVTNSYPKERGSGQRLPDMKVWKMSHRGSDPSNLDKLCTPVAEARLVSYWHTFVTFLLLSVLSHLQFASLCRKKYKKEVIKKYDEGFNYEEEHIDDRAVYASGGGKYMDSEIDALFCLTL
jgi:hypothetical protein